MKFTCDKCRTKYSIADERVKGRVLKIRCKSCNHVITVREAEPAPSIFGASGGPTSPESSASLGHLENMFDDGEHTKVSSGPLSGMMEPTPAGDEWYVSFDGEQEGPFPLSRAVERVRQEQSRGKEIHCWRPGFFVWLPLEEVPDFTRRLNVGRPPAVPAAAKAPPAPKAVGAQRATSGAGNARKEPAGARKPAVTRDPTGPRAALAVANAQLGSSKDGATSGDSDALSPDGAAAQAARAESPSAYRKATSGHAQVAKAPSDAPVVKRAAFPAAVAHLERKSISDVPRPASSAKLPAVRVRTDGDKHHGENGFAAALTANAGGAPDPFRAIDSGPVPLPPPPGDDLPIGEASGLLNLSHLKPGISGVRARGPAVETFGGVPVTSTPAQTHNGAGSSPTASPVVVVTGPAPSAVPPWMKWAAIAGLAMTALLASVVVYLVTRPQVVKTVEVETPSRKLNDNPIAMFDPGVPGQPAQPGQDARKAAAQGPRRAATKNVPGAKPGPVAAGDPQKGLSSAQRNLAQLYGEAETAQPHALPSVAGAGRRQAQVNESALAGVVQQNKAAMGLCYQRVLKHDPTLKSAKMLAKVKIGISGRVTNVSFADPTLGQAEIGQCLAQSIKRWTFPSSDSDYDFEFPIVLTAN